MKPITSDQYPLPAKRPGNLVTSKDKIKRVFGIEMPRWEDQLRAFLAGLSGAELSQDDVTDAFVFRGRFDLSGATPQDPGDI